jgi:hypothetical protein
MVIPFDFEYAREAVELNNTDIIFRTKSGHYVDLRHFRDPRTYGEDYLVEGFMYWDSERHRAKYTLWTMEGKLRNDGLETDMDLVIEIIKL